jgi:hypothetical protein
MPREVPVNQRRGKAVTKKAVRQDGAPSSFLLDKPVEPIMLDKGEGRRKRKQKGARETL